jgi:hypothetical protein
MNWQFLADRRYTTDTIEIVRQRWPRAAARGMSVEFNEQTAPMLALWAILRWERVVGLIALERCGVDPDALARDVDEALASAFAEIHAQIGRPTRHALATGQLVINFDEDAPFAALLPAAENEARGLRHNWVGTEHLVLAIIHHAGPRLRDVLDRHCVSYGTVRCALLDLLRPNRVAPTHR